MQHFKIPPQLVELLSTICDAEETAYQNLATALQEVLGTADAANKAQNACAEARKRLQSIVDGEANWNDVCPMTAELVTVAISAGRQSEDNDPLSGEFEEFVKTDLTRHIRDKVERGSHELKHEESALADIVGQHRRRILEHESEVAASVSELESYKHVFAFTNDVVSFLDRNSHDRENSSPNNKKIFSEGCNDVEDFVQNEMPALITACEEAQRRFDSRMTAMGMNDLRLLPSAAQRESTNSVVAPKEPSVEEPSGLLNFGNCTSFLRGARATPKRVTATGDLSPITQTETAMRSPQRKSLSPLNVSVKDRLKGRLTLDARKVFEEEKALAMLDDWGRSTPLPEGKRPQAVKLQLPEPVAPTGGGDYSFRETTMNTARFGESPDAPRINKPIIPKRRMSLTAKALNSIAALEPHLLLN